MSCARAFPFSGAWVMGMLLAAIAASFLASSGPIQWMDNGVFLADASRGRFFADSLGPSSHPFYQLLSTLLYAGFGAQALSLMNSVLLIPLAGIVYALARNLGVARHLALLAAITTVLAHGVFWVSTKAEVYLLHSLFVLAAYALYFDTRLGLGTYGKLLLISVLTGAAAAIHQLTFLVLLPLYVQMLLQWRARLWITLPGVLLGFAVAMPAIANDLTRGMSLLEIARRFLTGATPGTLEGAGALLRFDDMWHEKNAVALLMLSLMGPQLLGLLLFPRTRALQLLWAAVLLNFIFAVSYNVVDRFTFFLPGVALASVLGVIQLSRRLPPDRLGATLLYLSPLAGPAALLTMWMIYANGLVKLPTHTEVLPFRNDIHYFMVPYLPDRSAEHFVLSYQSLLPEGSMILADRTPMGALRSAQASGLLAGRTVAGCEQPRNLEDYLDGAGVFLPRTSFCGNLNADYRLDPGLLGYRLQAR